MKLLTRFTLPIACALSLAAPGAFAREVAFESVQEFAARATTRQIVFDFRAPAFGVAHVELALPAKGEKAGKHVRTVHVKPGRARIELAIEAPAGPLEYSFEADFPEYVSAGEVGTFGRGEGQFVKPTHVALSPRGEAYVVDTGNDRVQVFDRHLGFLFQFGTFNPSPSAFGAAIEVARFDEPWDIVINGNQELYITDQHNRKVVRFDMLGRVISEFGRDELTIPKGIATDVNRELYVCDSDNDRILVYSRDGRLLKKIGKFGWGAQQFKYPSDAALTRDGTLYVADSGNKRVQVFDRFERPLAILEGPFQSPDNLHLDADGFLWVVDSGANRIFRYAADHTLVASYPGPRDGYSLDTPTDCARAPDGSLYIVDSGHARILILEERKRAFRRTGTVDAIRVK